jgi:hypothetical protein
MERQMSVGPTKKIYEAPMKREGDKGLSQRKIPKSSKKEEKKKREEKGRIDIEV